MAAPSSYTVGRPVPAGKEFVVALAGLFRQKPFRLLVFASCGLAVGWLASTQSPLTRHMGSHIILMNVIAPLAALAFMSRFGALFGSGRSLFVASALQVVALWAVHLPPVIGAAAASEAIHIAVQAALLICALAFWFAVFNQRGNGRAGALVALLVTGKLFCLLGALLVFAPRTVYAASIWEICAPTATPASMLEDQQFAGLLMLTACPLSYVAAGIAISAIWLAELRDKSKVAV